MFPEATHIHEAEIYLSGLIEPVEKGMQENYKPEDIQYEFCGDIRWELLENLPGIETINVFNIISEFIEEHVGSAKHFRGVLFDPSSAKGNISFSGNRIANIAGKILETLGGEHARFVRRMRKQFKFFKTKGDITFQSVRITKIRAIRNIPLYKDGKIIFPTDIWDENSRFGKDGGTCNPIVFLINGTSGRQKTLEIFLTLNGVKSGEQFQLDGIYLNKGTIVSGIGTVHRFNNSLVSVHVRPRVEPKEFFRINSQELHWEISMRGTSLKTKVIFPANFDIYWIYAFDGELFRRGLPIEILEQVGGICENPDWRGVCLAGLQFV